MDQISQRRASRLTEPDLSKLVFKESPTGRIARSGWPYDYQFGPSKFRDSFIDRKLIEDGVMLNVDYSAIEQRIAAHYDEDFRRAIGVQTQTAFVAPPGDNTLTIDKLNDMMAIVRKLMPEWNVIVFTPYIKDSHKIRRGCMWVPWELQFKPAIVVALNGTQPFAPRVFIGGAKGSRGRRIQRLRAVLRTAQSARNVAHPEQEGSHGQAEHQPPQPSQVQPVRRPESDLSDPRQSARGKRQGQGDAASQSRQHDAGSKGRD